MYVNIRTSTQTRLFCELLCIWMLVCISVCLHLRKADVLKIYSCHMRIYRDSIYFNLYNDGQIENIYFSSFCTFKLMMLIFLSDSRNE